MKIKGLASFAVVTYTLLMGLATTSAQDQPGTQEELGAPSTLDLEAVKKGDAAFATAADKYCYIYQWGAFELLGNNASGTLILNTGFPAGNKCFHVRLTYVGKYQDPHYPTFKGDLYQGTINGKNRYFLFGDTDIQGPGRRWIVYYLADGKLVYYDIANVAKQ